VHIPSPADLAGFHLSIKQGNYQPDISVRILLQSAKTYEVFLDKTKGQMSLSTLPSAE
jgi:hypothetical protein